MYHLLNLAEEVFQHLRKRKSLNLSKNGFFWSCLNPWKNCRCHNFFYVCILIIK